MSDIKIETGIPLALDGRDRTKYPFAKMNIGDSFFIDNVHAGDKLYSSISSASRGYGHRHNKKFKQRRENNGVRVWRVA